MRGVLVLAVVCWIGPAEGLAQHSDSPYAGHQHREIKALSAEQVDGYRNGEGMGMALAAELNSYPGPRHVLELTQELGLDAEQVRRARQIHESMKSEAVELGGRVVEAERRLDRAFAERTITAASLDSLTAEIAGLQGRLRAAHLRAHLSVAELLSPAQRRAYDRLRGYAHH